MRIHPAISWWLKVLPLLVSHFDSFVKLTLLLDTIGLGEKLQTASYYSNNMPELYQLELKKSCSFLDIERFSKKSDNPRKDRVFCGQWCYIELCDYHTPLDQIELK